MWDNRIAALRRRVRIDGRSIDAAARECGVDPIVAHLWLRLPDGFSAMPTPTQVRWPTARRALPCRVVTAALVELQRSGTSLELAAETALVRGLEEEWETGAWRHEGAALGAALRYVEGVRPLPVAVPVSVYAAVLEVAVRYFGGDPRPAAGWLIARGVGINLAAPSRPPRARRLPSLGASGARGTADAPSGETLRQMREALGLTQATVAARARVSRGTVAETERGRRLSVATRQLIAETLSVKAQIDFLVSALDAAGREANGEKLAQLNSISTSSIPTKTTLSE